MSKPISEIIQDYLAKGDNTGWFEEVYSRVKESDGHPPWAYMQATPDLVAWADAYNVIGTGKSAIVIGCGMGDDAEFLAERGFNVTAFDVSQTAINICRQRFPDSRVTYQKADLFNLPDSWQTSFDFVLENRTIQALPYDIYQKTMTAIAHLVADNGQLLILCNGRDEHEAKGRIPWLLSRAELGYFAELGLEEIHFDDKHEGSVRRFVVLYQK